MDARRRSRSRAPGSSYAVHSDKSARAVRFSRDDAQRLLEQARRELEDFFKNAPVPLQFVDASGTIVRANRAELELLGYSADEYVGHNVAEFHVDPPVADDMLRRLGCGETLGAYPAGLRGGAGPMKRSRRDAKAAAAAV